MKRIKGYGYQKCIVSGCAKRTLTGFLDGRGLCRYHFVEGTWGKRWANHVVNRSKEPEFTQ